MAGYRQQLGRWGEKTAEDFLVGHGYRVIDRRWHGRYGEIDLVASDPDAKTLVFVEVKTRTSGAFGGLDASIDRRKLARLSLALERYVAEHRYRGPYRLDVILILKNAKISLRHIQNISTD